MNHRSIAVICSLLAVYGSCALHFTDISLSGIQILDTVSHCVPLCRVLITAIRCVYPFGKNEADLAKGSLSFKMSAPKCDFVNSICGVNHGVENHAG